MPVMNGLLALPNEVLLGILNTFSTRDLLPLTTTCKHVHSLVLRLLFHRLNVATVLGGYTLYIECYHPSARLTAGQLFCTSLGTDGLDELYDKSLKDPHCTDQLGHMQKLYTRFRPQRREPDISNIQRHPAGDVPGSRTYPPPKARARAQEPEELVTETVTVDANDLFTQLTTVAYLGKREPRRGLLSSIQEVTEGIIRVWRDWLSKQCESRTFSDDTTVSIQQDVTSSFTVSSNGQTIMMKDLAKDPSILWVNTRDNCVGLRLRVKSQKRRLETAPLIYQNDVDVPVSYIVQFEEVLIRTSHLLLKLEEAQQQMINDSGKAVVFGSYA